MCYLFSSSQSCFLIKFSISCIILAHFTDCVLLCIALQSGQHSFDSRNSPGPREANSQRDCQQQWASAYAEHQCWVPITENAHTTQWWGEAQQGGSLKVPHGWVKMSLFLLLWWTFFKLNSVHFPPKGCHSATDGRIHFHPGAGKDSTVTAEQPAEANHTSKPSVVLWWPVWELKTHMHNSVIR